VTAASDDDSDDKRDQRAYQCKACSAKGEKPVSHAKKKARFELPRHIEDALAGASYQVRSSDGDGFPRVVVSIPAFGSLMLGGKGGEDIADRIERVWPDLGESEVRRVIQYIDAGCNAAIRALNERPGRPKRSWVRDGRSDYPIQTYRDF
jgi:hypothetical protein